MDVEGRLLLYMIAIGAAASIGFVVLRRARELAVHAAILGVLLAAAIAILVSGAAGAPFAAPLGWAYALLGVGPYFAVMGARRAAAARRFGLAAWALAAAALALGGPRHLRREAGIHRALAALDAGDVARGRAHLESLAPSERPGDPERVRDLAVLLPAFQEERWADVLACADAAERRSATVLSLEAQAAAEAGDVRRALRVAAELARRLDASSPPVTQARAAILAAAGRYEVIESAERRGLAVTDLPAATRRTLVARALEAAGERDRAAAAFGEAAKGLRGIRRRQAVAGRERCLAGALRRAQADEIEAAGLHELEAAFLAAPADPRRRPLFRRAPATLAVCGVTAVLSIAVFATMGSGEIALSAAGALGDRYVLDDGEWDRVITAMFLHGGGIHLALNLLSILFVGVPYEERAGAVRTVIVYVGAGIAASLASVLLAGTPVGVGASGAAMGLVGALGVTALADGHLFARQERRTWLGVVAASVVANALVGAVEHRSIDNAAHAGGLVAGALIAWALRPRADGGEAGRAVRRIVAASLVTAAAAAVAARALAIPRWLGTQRISHAGVIADAPAWLRPGETTAAGAVFVRRPLPFLAGIAPLDRRDPAGAALIRRLRRALEGDGAPAAALRFELRAQERDGLRVDEATIPAPGLGAEEGPAATIRILRFRRGGACAVVAHPGGPEAEATYGAARDLIARTLRAGSGTEGGGEPGETPGAGPSPVGSPGGR